MTGRPDHYERAPWEHRETIGNADIYLGDCREILPALGSVDSVITDPVWPNCPPGMLPGSDGQQAALLSDALSLLHQAHTVVIILGFGSDPRFLSAVCDRWPYIRSQQLPYSFPGYVGRLLGGDDVAYIFGEIPKGRGLIPGRARSVTTPRRDRATGHPCPRADDHMFQLIGWWSPPAGSVADPFMGTGATGVAAIRLDRRFIGIEIEPRYFEIACERIDAATRQLPLFVDKNTRPITEEIFAKPAGRDGGR